MPVIIEPQAPLSLAEADLTPRGRVFPSPTDWRDQVLYFLLPDRFSDGREAERPMFDPNHPEKFRAADLAAWRRCGKVFQGGTLNGITSKLDYLKGLGVTALWVGPIWKQRADLETYHGYGIQNFLEIDPRFGTRQDLRDLVDAAHDREMYVLLDIIYNHSGNNFFYANGSPHTTLPYRFAPSYPFGGWRSGTGQPTFEIQGLEDGVWPREFQTLDWYTRAGMIGRWDPEPWEDPLSPDNEFRRGDFFDLKDIDTTDQDEALSAVIRAYQYWIALSDCDGFRIDTVKHISFEASRHFCGAIHEYAESIGKENFWLLGEVTGGGEMARNYLDIFGRNIDAALDIGEPASILAGMVKGLGPASDFFAQFGGHSILGGHRETGRYHVSILDDHDMVGRGRKARFAAGSSLPSRFAQSAHAVGTQSTTLGAECIYYGTEQAFDGNEGSGDASDPGFEDRYIRESMFGGSFGAFETTGCHFFNPDHPTYLRIAAINAVRNGKNQVGLALRRGRQYQRETSFLGLPFSMPKPGELVAWSRLQHKQEVLTALNSHADERRGAEVTVDAGLHPPGSHLAFLYRSDWSDAELKNAAQGNPPAGQTVEVRLADGRATVRLDLPPAGMAILA